MRILVKVSRPVGRREVNMDGTILVTSFVAAVLYLNTLDADFAYDDSRAIVKNQDLEPQTPLINIFYDDFWGTPLTHSGSHKSYRPLCVLTFRLNYYLGQLNPWGYHLGNVILHAIVTGFFTKLSRIILKHTFPTLVSGLIFASHPVHTEAVAGVVGRADVGACLFFIIALMTYMKYVTLRDKVEESRSQRFLYIGGTAVLTSASMLTKEQGVTVLGVCAAYDIFVHNKMTLFQIIQFYKQPRHRRAMEGVILLGLVGIGLVAFRVYFMGNKPPEFAPSDNPASDSNSVLTRILTYLLLPSLNMWLLLCPRILSFDWSMTSIPLVESLTDYRNIFSLMFYLSLIYFAYLSFDFIHHHSKDIVPYMNGHSNSHMSSKISTNKSKTFQHQTSINGEHSKKTFINSSNNLNSSNISPHSINVIIFSAAIIVLPFIPAANIFFYVGFVIAERVLYIPSMGFCLLVGHGSYLIYKKFDSGNGLKWKQTVIKLFIGMLIIFNSMKTYYRNYDWKTEENLYTSGISVNPAKAWGNLANIYNSQGRVTDAETAYRNALKYRPNMSDVHYNLGILLQNQKRIQEALESYRRAIGFRPNLSMAHLNLAILLAQIGENKEAETVYRHCADLETSKLKDPRLHDSTKISCLYNLGRLYTDQQRYEEALATFEEALKKRPDHYAPQSIYNMYGEVYANTGQFRKAEYWYREALKVKPDHIPAHLTMGKLKHKEGLIAEAEEWFKKAQKLDPDGRDLVQNHYAEFLGQTGRLEQSGAIYKSIIQRDPNNFEMVFNAANIFRQLQKNNEAEKLFKKASELRPKEATAHMNLGAMYHINGKLKEGERSYLRALELKPNDQITMDNLKKIRNLMASS